MTGQAAMEKLKLYKAADHGPHGMLAYVGLDGIQWSRVVVVVSSRGKTSADTGLEDEPSKQDPTRDDNVSYDYDL